METILNPSPIDRYQTTGSRISAIEGLICNLNKFEAKYSDLKKIHSILEKKSVILFSVIAMSIFVAGNEEF